MFKKALLIGVSVMVLSGCSLTLGGGRSDAGSVWKSQDGGKTFEPKIKIDKSQSIASSDILSLAMHPADPQTIYIGTLENGIFKTTDGAETWEHLEFPPIKVYGLVIDPSNGERVFATGTYENIGKIYRSDDGGASWQETYTEPGSGTVITALAISPDNPATLMAGTSAGVVIQSADGGATWKNILAAQGAVTKAFFERGLPGMRVLLVFKQGTMASQDGGVTWQDNSGASTSYATAPDQVPQPKDLFTLTQDPQNTALIYGGGSNGLFRSADRGRTWKVVNIIESSKSFPIRAIAVNPRNANEIVYGSGSAFYKSNDGGSQWSVTDLKTGRGMSTLAYDPLQPEILYFTLRKY